MKEEKIIKSFNENARTPCKCEVFSRSMGFYRPVSYFNIGKYQEYSERNMFKENKCLSVAERHLSLMKDSLLQKAA